MDARTICIRNLKADINELKENVEEGYRLDGFVVTSKEHEIRGYIFALSDADIITREEKDEYLLEVKKICKEI